MKHKCTDFTQQSWTYSMNTKLKTPIIRAKIKHKKNDIKRVLYCQLYLNLHE